MPEDWELLKTFLPPAAKSEEKLLRVLLMHLGCGYSLRETVVRAKRATGGVVGCGAVSAEVWGVAASACVELYVEGERRALPGAGVEVRVIDATKGAGKSGSLWRALRPVSRATSSVTGTEGKGSGESLTHFPIRAGDLVLADRGYSLAPGIVHVAAAGGYLTVRVNTRALVLATPAGEPLDLLARVSSLRRADQVGF